MHIDSKLGIYKAEKPTDHSRNCKVDDQCSWAASPQSRTRTNEQASADAASNGNHVQMPGLQRLVKLIVPVLERSLLEGFRGTAHASPESQRRRCLQRAV